jgi:hypothetical protein
MHDDIRSKFILAKRRLGLSMKDRTLGDMSRDVCGWGGGYVMDRFIVEF